SHRSNLHSWATPRVELEADTTFDIAIPLTRVRGSVELGGQPLAALITFGDDKGMRLPLRSKSDGTFLTLLPKIADDTWPHVEIESSTPRVSRTLTNVKIDGADTPEAFLDIQLASTSIEGVVVDEGGFPTRSA